MNPLSFAVDLVASTLRMMGLALAGIRSDELRWLAFDVRGLSERRLWWMSTVLSISPASVAVTCSDDGRWLYVHTVLADDDQRRAFARSFARAAGLREAHVLEAGPSERPVAPARPPDDQPGSPPPIARTDA